ncbi:MAG: hypothetical protein FWE21_08630 [Defluviitaleaceae bacterium]|nr:hypothetical protein [Defluviitaleaceae bacterium]
MLLIIIPPLLIVVAFLGLLLSTCFSRTKTIIYTGATALAVLLGMLGANAFHLRFPWSVPIAFTFAFPWMLVMLIAVAIIVGVYRKKEEPAAPETRLRMVVKANKWFLMALAGILVSGIPLYWDWNIGTSHRGYSFNPAEPADVKFSSPSPIRFTLNTLMQTYKATNADESNGFHGEGIVFVEDNHLIFDGIYFFYSIQNRGFGLWHDVYLIRLLPPATDQFYLGSYMHNIPRLGFGKQINTEENERYYIVFSAIANTRLVQSVGFADNFFRVIRVPTLSLLAVYIMNRIGLWVKWTKEARVDINT